MTPNFSLMARELVRDCINLDPETPAHVDLEDVFVVWFCKTLQNWKALVATTQPVPTYYEVTHNGDKGETYVDIYTKIDQILSTSIPGKAS
jgi:hypothetical protein